MDTTPTVPPPKPVPPPAAPVVTPAPTGHRALALLDGVRAARATVLRQQGLLLAITLLALGTLAGGFLGVAHPLAARVVLALTALAALALGALFALVLVRRRVGDQSRTARSLAERIPELNQDLLSAVELSRALGERHDFSPELARAFLADVDRRALALTPSALVDATPARNALALALLSVSALALGFAFRPERLQLGLSHALWPSAAPVALSREPITGDFELQYRYPVHTGLEPRTVTGTAGEVQGPAGTEVRVRTHADRDVSSAALLVNAARVPLTVKGRELEGTFVLGKSGQYHVAFLDGDTVVAEGPDLPLQVDADAPPQVRLTAPLDKLEVAPDATQVTLKYEATDDWGLTALELVYRVQGRPEKRVTLRPDDGRTTRGSYAWEVGALGLTPGLPVSYYLEARDNDGAGAKAGVSATQTLTLYSAAEHRRAALDKALALWERFVTHLADRLEGPDRLKAAPLPTPVPVKAIDERAQALVTDFDAFADAQEQERERPIDLLLATRTIAAELQQDTVAVTGSRRLLDRFKDGQGGLSKDLGQRLVRAVGEDIRHSEKNVLYLELLLDRQKVQALKELAEQLRADRRELSRLVEDYAKSKDDAAKQALIDQMEALRNRMMDLQRRMAELAKGIRDEHMNREALEEMMDEQNLGSTLDQLEKLVKEGKTDEALKKMQELAMEMDQFLEKVDRAEEESDEQADPELSRMFDQFQKDLEATAQKQEALSAETKALKEKALQQARERIAEQGAQLKRELSQKVEELKKDYGLLDDTRLGFRSREVRQKALSDASEVKQALDASDFDLAAESAENLAEKAQGLSEMAEEQKRLDEQFRNPEASRRESRQLAEKLGRDARTAQDIAKKLRDLFPQGQQMSQADQQELAKQQKAQRELQKQAGQLQQQMQQMGERAPVFDQEAEAQMQQAGQRMGNAADRLGAKDPSRSFGEQQGALQAMRGLQQQMQQQQKSGGKSKGRGLPMPMSLGSKGHGNASREKVEIPEEDPDKAPREFRKDVMDAMKQGAPDRYRDQNKRYYEELVK